jgi:hypothetical protein
LDFIVRIARRWPRLLLRRLRVPQIDMQTLDLFDQQQNRFSGRPKIVIAIGMKTYAPGTKLLDLALVQPIAQGRPPPRSLVAYPTRETHTLFSRARRRQSLTLTNHSSEASWDWSLRRIAS